MARQHATGPVEYRGLYHYYLIDEDEHEFRGVFQGSYAIEAPGLFFLCLIGYPLVAMFVSGAVYAIGGSLLWIVAAYGTLWTARQAMRGVKLGNKMISKLDEHKTDPKAHTGDSK